LLIFNPKESHPKDRDIPWHGAKGEGHLAFSLPTGSIEKWKQRLAKCNVPIEKEVEWTTGCVSLYFRDSTGNSVELVPSTLWGRGLAILKSIPDFLVRKKEGI